MTRSIGRSPCSSAHSIRCLPELSQASFSPACTISSRSALAPSEEPDPPSEPLAAALSLCFWIGAIVTWSHFLDEFRDQLSSFFAPVRHAQGNGDRSLPCNRSSRPRIEMRSKRHNNLLLL